MNHLSEKNSIFNLNILHPMRKILPLLLLFIFSISVFGQKVVTKKYESEELQDIRTLQIHLPNGYERDTISKFQWFLRVK